ncbi:MAG: PLP-dependent transferase [Limnohabitans sp.]|nr:PLP-dependent transferase [Limnohabitans sp.]
MQNLFQNIPCGKSIPLNNPHAVSVSLPKMSDIIGYEEGDINVVGKMEAGYPRFFRNKYVQKLVEYVTEENKISDTQTVIPITSFKAYELVCHLLAVKFNFVQLADCVFLIIDSNDEKLKLVKEYIQNAGLIISSRQAENVLLELPLIESLYEETKNDFLHSINAIQKVLVEAYNVDKQNILLTNNGANAVFAACEGVSNKGYKGKKGIVQLGWLYLDTMEIVKKRAETVHLQLNVFDLESLENWLSNNHHNIGAVVSEIVSNPKIECLDIEKLYAICKKYDVLLILDATLITPFNVDVLEYCDIAVESLSKFACGNADVLMGAVISRNADLLIEANKFALSPFKGEIERLGYEILGYEDRVKRISDNTIQLLEYFSKQESVKKVMSVYTGNSKNIYQRLANSKYIPGLISVVFHGKLSDYYDKLQLAKGPSLGTEFTLAMPYVYLAHYDLIQTEEGRKYLNENGIETELLRISVGLEPIEEIISIFDNIFQS